MSKAVALSMALLLSGASAFAWTPAAFAQGDGSATNNADLLRGSVAPGCEPGLLCNYKPVATPMPVVPSTAPATPIVLTAPQAPVSTPETANTARAPLVQWEGAPADLTPAWHPDLSLALRGSYVSSDNQQRYEAQIIPQAGLSYSGGDTNIDISASAVLVQPDDDSVRLGGAGINLSVGHQLGPVTGLALDADLSMSQDSPGGLDQTLTAVASAPVEIDGSAQLALARQFGRADAVVTGRVSRTDVGTTELNDGTFVSNREDNVTRFGGGIRLGYAVTPVVGTYVQGDIDRDDFDIASPTLGVRQSGVTYGLRTGLTADWGSRTTGEAYIGSEWREFDSAALSSAQALVYGAALGHAPSTTTSLRASFDTRLVPGTAGSAARVDYTLALEAAYRINTWVSLRGTGAASWEDPLDGTAPTRRYSAGLGADFTVNANTDLTLDYAYGSRDDPAATPRVRDEHRLSAGATFRY